jgi:hypothetical protein
MDVLLDDFTFPEVSALEDFLAGINGNDDDFFFGM